MKAKLTLAAFSCATFLLFFRPALAFSPFGNLDPQCYLTQLHHFLKLAGPACESSAFLPGTALAWLPGGALAFLISRLTGVGPDALIRVSVGLTSFSLWVASLGLIHGILVSLDPKAKASRSILWILSVPVLYYASIRTMLSHSVEFFFACLCAFLVVKKRFWPALLAASLSCLTRFNDLPWLLIVGAAAWRAQVRTPAWWAAWTTVSGLFAGWVAYVGFFSGYHEIRVPFLVASSSWDRLSEVLLGSDWGLLWMSPAWLLVLTAALYQVRKLSWPERAYALSMAANLALCVSWRGNGGDFGYRYLVGTFPAALLLWFSLKDRLPAWQWPAKVALAWGALWTTYLTWIYRTAPELTPMKPTDDWGAMVPDFQWSAVIALFNPSRWAAPLVEGPVISLWQGNLARTEWWAVLATTLFAALFLIGNQSRLRR